MALQTNNSAENISAMNPDHFSKSMSKPLGSQIVLLQTKFCIVKGRKKYHQDTCYVLAKRHISGRSDVKQKRNQVCRPSIVELCLVEGIS